jgi:hypothetical protein
MKRTIASIAFMLCLLSAFSQKKKDEEAIKKVLEKESATWRSGDVKAHAACWKIRPYSRILVSTADGRTFDVPPSAVINPDVKNMDIGGTSFNTNYKMSINGNSAWVSHDEESTSKYGKKTYSYEMRMLEKIGGEWKLVGQSIHLYNK